MASSINASTAGAGGVITTADASGVLNLQSGGTTVATVSSTGFSTPANQTINTANTFGFKNRIINGGMTIDQRNGGASVTPANSAVTFAVDRFGIFVNQASKLTAQQSTTAPVGFINSLKVTSSSSYSVISTDVFNFQQAIEGLNVADLAWGTANAKTVTLSFWVYSSLTGTFGGAVLNSAQNRSYSFSYVINSANTWEQKSITIPGDTTGTWLTTNGIGLTPTWSLGAGSNYLGTPNAWASAAYYSVTGATNLVGTNGATWYITGVQLEVGSQATSFDFRSATQELALCQRYYEICQANFYNANCVVNYFGACVNYSVTKRANPTITLVATQASSGVNGAVYGEAQSIYGFRAMALSSVAGTMAFQSTLSASIEL